jgi:L-aspartate oxidase
LASNSLLEGLVFGARAAAAAIESAARESRTGTTSPAPSSPEGGPFRSLEDAEKLLNSLRRLMWGKVGIVRTRESLVSAVAQLSRWQRVVEGPFRSRRDVEIENMVQIARCIAESALWRENSVGAHYRADFPEPCRAGWKDHSRVEGLDGISGPRPATPKPAAMGVTGRRP